MKGLTLTKDGRIFCGQEAHQQLRREHAKATVVSIVRRISHQARRADELVAAAASMKVLGQQVARLEAELKAARARLAAATAAHAALKEAPNG